MKFLLLTALKDYLKKKINISFQKVPLLSLNYIFACDVCSHKGVRIKNFIICHRKAHKVAIRRTILIRTRKKWLKLKH